MPSETSTSRIRADAISRAPGSDCLTGARIADDLKALLGRRGEAARRLADLVDPAAIILYLVASGGS